MGTPTCSGEAGRVRAVCQAVGGCTCRLTGRTCGNTDCTDQRVEVREWAGRTLYQVVKEFGRRPKGSLVPKESLMLAEACSEQGSRDVWVPEGMDGRTGGGSVQPEALGYNR